MHLLASLAIAFSTYSRIPMPQVDWTDENRRYVMCFFPLIGFMTGALLWLWLWVCDRTQLSALPRGAIGALIPLAVTGGIHMDGFMDTSDALGSGQSKERKLEILHDSHVGAFAVMGCASCLLLQTAMLSEAGADAAPQLAMLFVASRAMSALTMCLLPPARSGGMLNTFAVPARRTAVCACSGVWLALCIIAWAWMGGWLALICAAVILSVTLYYRHMAMNAFGGVTGDLAGWYLQVMELCLIIAVVAGREWL